jgi:hypothetical protein
MSEQPTGPRNTSDSGSNGQHEHQPDQEAKMKTTYTHSPYDLEDFSQNRINRGQQQINYLVTAVDEKIVVALKELSYAIAKLAGDKVDLRPVDHAIEEVSAATKKVAGEFPPGCGSERKGEE